MSTKAQLLLFCLIVSLFLVPVSYAESSIQVQNNQSIVLNLQNMTCAMCKYTIKKALLSVKGTKKVSVNFEDKTAFITFNPQETSADTLIKAITNAGYPATKQTIRN